MEAVLLTGNAKCTFLCPRHFDPIIPVEVFVACDLWHFAFLPEPSSYAQFCTISKIITIQIMLENVVLYFFNIVVLNPCGLICIYISYEKSVYVIYKIFFIKLLSTVEVWEYISYFIPHHTVRVITYPCFWTCISFTQFELTRQSLTLSVVIH